MGSNPTLSARNLARRKQHDPSHCRASPTNIPHCRGFYIAPGWCSDADYAGARLAGDFPRHGHAGGRVRVGATADGTDQARRWPSKRCNVGAFESERDEGPSPTGRRRRCTAEPSRPLREPIGRDLTSKTLLRAILQNLRGLADRSEISLDSPVTRGLRLHHMQERRRTLC